MADLERLNELYDLCRPVTAEDQLRAQRCDFPPLSSLEGIESELKRHRDRHARGTEDYARLDTAVEALELQRRSER